MQEATNSHDYERNAKWAAADEQMELAMRFQVSSIPMLVVFKDGKAVAKSVGYRPKSEIAAMVEDAR